MAANMSVNEMLSSLTEFLGFQSDGFLLKFTSEEFEVGQNWNHLLTESDNWLKKSVGLKSPCLQIIPLKSS